MKKNNKRLIRIIISIIVSVFLFAIAWTNEAMDYLIKFGVQGIEPAYVLLITTFLFIVSGGWVLWEIFNK